MQIKQRNDKLTKEQELELGRKIQAMEKLTSQEDYDYYKLSKEEVEVVEVGKKSLEILVGNYINLARDIAHRTHKKTGTKYELEDLIQDAITALVSAACSYDPSRECKLGTHAYYGIAKKVSSTINSQRLVRLPENKMGEYIKITDAQKAYQSLSNEAKAGYKNELDYVYKHSGVKKGEVNIILQNMQPQVSLNTALYDNKGELLETLTDESSERDIREVEKLDPKLEYMISQLNQYQKDLIGYEFEVIQPSVPYKEFLQIHNLTERDFKRETRKVVTVLSNIAKRKKIKIAL